MSFLGTIALIAIGAGAVKIGIDTATDKISDYFRKMEEEQERIEREEHNKRLFSKISQEEFKEIAEKAVIGLPRIVRTTVYGASVLVTLESKSGLTEWDFTLDFDNCGSLTGDYKVWSEHDNSAIPDALGRRIQRELMYRLY